jgi:hypothetical protein
MHSGGGVMEIYEAMDAFDVLGKLYVHENYGGMRFKDLSLM